jgi:ribosomal protein S27AE
LDRQCRECGSERIAPGLRLAEGAPAGSLLARLRAWVCGDCGSTQLHAEAPLDLYLAHKRRVEGEGTPAAPGGEGRPAEGGPPAANIQCPSCGSVLSAAATACEVCGWRQGQAGS